MRKRTREGLEIIALLGLASLVAAFSLSQGAGPAPTAEQKGRIEQGGRTYRVYCASCHGASATGDGPMAEALKVRPADLTRISERNGGTFSAGAVASAIDGRFEIRGHGPSSMPVWGLSFQEAGRDSDQEQAVREKIADLVAYLESVQK